MTGFTQLFLVTVTLSYTVIMLFVVSFRHKDNLGAVLLQYLSALYTALAENGSV